MYGVRQANAAFSTDDRRAGGRPKKKNPNRDEVFFFFFSPFFPSPAGFTQQSHTQPVLGSDRSPPRPWYFLGCGLGADAPAALWSPTRKRGSPPGPTGSYARLITCNCNRRLGLNAVLGPQEEGEGGFGGGGSSRNTCWNRGGERTYCKAVFMGGTLGK